MNSTLEKEKLKKKERTIKSFMGKRSTKALFFLIFFLISFANSSIIKRPNMFISDTEKEKLILKIKKYQWAGNIYKSMLAYLDPFVDRHQKDPSAILSKMQMYWRRPFFTNFNRSGNYLNQWKGDAPVPTIRIQSYLRVHNAPDGYPYLTPRIEEVTSFSTNGLLRLQTSGPSKKWYNNVDGGFVTMLINGSINQLAVASAFCYWLTGAEKYARFAADIFILQMNALKYHTMLSGSTACALLAMQTLDDSEVYAKNLALIYDFIHDYLKNNNGEHKTRLTLPDGNIYTLEHKISDSIETGFVKLAHAFAYRGPTGNNWEIVESLGLVMCSLQIDDPVNRNKYLSHFTSSPTANQRPLPVFLDHFTEEGLIKEPTSYHNYPLAYLIPGAYIADRSGTEFFKNYPKLYKMAYSLNYLSYPDGKTPTFGNNHSRASVLGRIIEIAYHAAVLNNDMEEAQILGSELRRLIQLGAWSRESGGSADFHSVIRLITSEGEINAKKPMPLPKSFYQSFASLYIKRNGEDPKYGLMYALYGSGHGHGQVHGPTIELYGQGFTLGVDPGAEVRYEDERHGHYYIQFAAHNNVIVNGASQADTVNPGNPFSALSHSFLNNLTIEEPKSMEPPLSPFYSFTDVQYNETSTASVQRRVTAIIRTSEKSGYYVDLFRSVSTGVNYKHEYIYHNIGDTIKFTTEEGVPIPMTAPIVTGDLDEWRGATYLYKGPGYRGPSGQYYNQRKKIENISTTVCAIVSAHSLGTEIVSMKAWLPSIFQRTYFSAMTPRARVAPAPYNDREVPTFVIRQTGEAWKRPFVAIYEPFVGNAESIESVKPLAGQAEGDLFAVAIKTKDVFTGKKGQYDLIFFSTNSGNTYSRGGITFGGTFAVVTSNENHIERLYLGNGQQLSTEKISILSPNTESIQAYLERLNDKWYLSSKQEVRISFRYKNKQDIPYAGLSMYYTESGKKLSEATELIVTPDPGVSAMGWGTVSAVFPAGDGNELRIAFRENEPLPQSPHLEFIIDGAVANKNSPMPIKEWLILITASNRIYTNDWRVYFNNDPCLPLFSVNNYSLDGKSFHMVAENINGLNPGQYRFIVQDSYGLTVTKDITLKREIKKVLLYPNPLSLIPGNFLNITLFLDGDETNTELLLCSLDGNMLCDFEGEKIAGRKGHYSFETELHKESGIDIPPGIYFLIFRYYKNGIETTQTTKMILLQD